VRVAPAAGAALVACLAVGCGGNAGHATTSTSTSTSTKKLLYPQPTGIVIYHVRGVGGSHNLTFINQRQRRVNVNIACYGPGVVSLDGPVFGQGGHGVSFPSCNIGDSGGFTASLPAGIVRLHLTAPPTTQWLVQAQFGHRTANAFG
jgi:hypothetical protein